MSNNGEERTWVITNTKNRYLDAREKGEEGGDKELDRGTTLVKRDDTEEYIEWDEEEKEEERDRLELGLVGRVFTERKINRHAFITTITCQPKHGVEIREKYFTGGTKSG